MQLLKSGKYDRIKQDESKATIYKDIRTPKDSHIDWNKPLKDLYNEIRACDPNDYPAYVLINGEKVYIKMWRSEKEEGESDMI